MKYTVGKVLESFFLNIIILTQKEIFAKLFFV